MGHRPWLRNVFILFGNVSIRRNNSHCAGMGFDSVSLSIKQSHKICKHEFNFPLSQRKQKYGCQNKNCFLWDILVKWKLFSLNQLLYPFSNTQQIYISEGFWQRTKCYWNISSIPFVLHNIPWAELPTRGIYFSASVCTSSILVCLCCKFSVLTLSWQILIYTFWLCYNL